MPKGGIQGKTALTGSPQIIQTSAGGTKTGIPQGATIVKLVNAPGSKGLGGAMSPQIVKMAGGAGNMVTLAKPGQTVAGKQTIVINKPGAQGTTLKGAQGQQIIMVCDAKKKTCEFKYRSISRNFHKIKIALSENGKIP